MTFLYQFNGTNTVEGNDNPFMDVDAGAYYYNAVLWAADKEITSGTTAATFSPQDTCTRAQIVTFLYNYYMK